MNVPFLLLIKAALASVSLNGFDCFFGYKKVNYCASICSKDTSELTHKCVVNICQEARVHPSPTLIPVSALIKSRDESLKNGAC